MADEGLSILPLLRELRSSEQQAPTGSEQRRAITDAWLKKLRSQPSFWNRVTQGEQTLFRYLEANIDRRLRAVEVRLAALEQK